MKRCFLWIVFLVLLWLPTCPSPCQVDSIWDLEAVDAYGAGTHPKVGASPLNPANRAIVQGIALNSPPELLNTGMMWQIYIQAEAPDKGSIAAWAGIFYNTSWPRYTNDIQPGDRIRLEGFIENHNGKVNFTERHSADPSLQFIITKLETGIGLPEPKQISDLSTCNYFDESRSGGGEKYQGQLVKLENVHILSGDWGNGKSLLVSDDRDSTLTMLLSSEGDFDGKTPPPGAFNVLGIFDQEDTSLPYHGEYRVWVKHYADILPPLCAKLWEYYE